MQYSTKDIEKIVGFRTWSPKQKEDELLKMDASIHCNLGSDSNQSEREGVRRLSNKIYRGIQKINPQLGDSLLSAIDK